MTPEIEQELHKLWNDLLRDDAVPAHNIVMAGLKRAFELGYERGWHDGAIEDESI